MKNIYSTYIAPAYIESIDNFCETNIYITRMSHDYIGKEEKFENIDSFGLGKPLEIEGGIGKYVKLKYIGKIENMGIIEANYDITKQEFEIRSCKPLKGKNDFESNNLLFRLRKCFLNQYNLFHDEESKEHMWTKKIKWLFVEVQKVNFYEDTALYKEKIPQDLIISYSDTGDLKKGIITYKYFKMSSDLYYDIEEGKFIKNGEQFLISSYNAELKKEFLKFLIKNISKVIEKETLMNYLGFKGIEGNKRLLDLKRSLIEVDFGKKLGIDKESVEKIIVAKQGQGYRIVGELTNEIN